MTRLLSDASDHDDWFPLTPMQEAYLVGQSGAYQMGNIPCLAHFTFDIPDGDPQRLERAWNALVQRHPALRTVFSIEHGQRVIAEVPHLAFDRVEQRDPEAVAALLAERCSDPSRWPLYACAVNEGNPTLRFHLQLNVLVADGHSIQTMFAELLGIYEGRADQLPLPEYEFKDYCNRLTRMIARKSSETDAYWTARLAALPPPPELPFQVTPAQIERPQFRRMVFELDGDQWTALRVQCTQRRLSPTSVFLASYLRTLSRFCRKKRFRIGVTAFQRPEWHPDIDAVVGDFTGLVPFVADLGAPAPFEAAAAGLQESLWEDLNQYSLANATVLRSALAELGSDEIPGLPVVFTSLLGKPRSVGNWQFAGGQTQTPQVWIDHQLVEVGTGVLCYWDAVEQLFHPGTLETMFADYGNCLRALAQGDGWNELPQSGAAAAVSGSAREGLLPAWPTCNAGDVAICTATTTLSHGQLWAHCDALAQRLRAAGARPGDRIGIVMSKDWQQVVAALATTNAGYVYVPLDPALPQPRLHQLLAACDIRTVITQPCWAESLDWPDGCGLLVQDHAAIAPLAGAPAAALRSVDDLAYIIFTSGSTGVPKGVAMRHGAVQNTLLDLHGRLAIGPGDRVLALSSLSFDLSVFDMYGLLQAGGAIVLPEADSLRDPQRWLELMVRDGVTIWNTVPALMEMLIEYLEGGTHQLPPLRVVMLSGDWIPVALPGRIRKLFPDAQVYSLGGATEAAIWSVIYPVGDVDPAWTSIPYGRALDGQSIDVYDEHMVRTADWVTGEIGIGGCGLASMYWNDPDLTASRFVRHADGSRLYRTGDLGRRHPDGTVEILGREDGQVKVNGFRVELGEIESTLDRHPTVQKSCAAVRDKKLVAYVIPSDGCVDETVLLAWLSDQLPPYLMPTRIVPLAALPLSSNGKFDRAALPAPTTALGSNGAALSETERAVCMLAGEVIGVDTPARDADFFRLGGTSIQLIRFQHRLNQHFGIACSLRAIAGDTVLASIAALVQSGLAQSAPEKPVPAFVQYGESTAAFPLTPLQQAYWLGRRDDFALGGVAPHVYLEFDADKFDVELAELAWNALVARHPALRTVFDEDGRQRVLERAGPVRFTVEPSQRREQVRRRMSHQVFDPAQWPLFDLAVTGDETGVRWHVSLDLLIGDAWSLQILAREFAALYAGQAELLQPLAVTYRDWVLWRESTLQGPERQRSLHYWTRRLATLPGPPPLDLRKQDGGAVDAQFQRCRFELAPALWDGLQRQALAHGITTVNVMLTAFATALSGGPGEFLLNVTFFNRGSEPRELSEVVGDFTSLLLLPCTLQADARFIDSARQLGTQLFEVMEHASFSAVEVMRLASQDRPIAAPVVFTSTLGVAQSEGAWPAFPMQEGYSVSQTPQVWLDNQLSEREGKLVVVWDFRRDLFAAGYIETLFDTYTALVTRLAAGDASAWTGQLSGERNTASAAAPAQADNKRYMELYRKRPAIRHDLASALPLPAARPIDTDWRSSTRQFSRAPVGLHALGELLAMLAETTAADRFVPRRRYGSAGSLYPVQTYLVARPGAIEGLHGGSYYYDPEANALRPCGTLDDTGHDDAMLPGFALHFVLEPAAIEPVYGARARDFGLIEAGLMAQLLENAAATGPIGLCQVGWPAPLGWRDAFSAHADTEHLHTLVGGLRIDAQPQVRVPVSAAPAVAATPARPDQSALSARLAATMGAVLGVPALAGDANFFRAGGDSVKAVRACARASQELGVQLTLRDLLENPTPVGWAAAVSARMERAGA